MAQFQASSRLDQTKQAVNAIKQSWDNSPAIFVFNGIDDPVVPLEVRSIRKTRGSKGQPSGFIYNDQVFINAAKMSSDADVAETLLHESIGHFGLRGTFGENLDKELKDLARLRPEEIEEVRIKYRIPDTEDGRLEAAEEVLADLAQTKPTITLVQSAAASIRGWLRDHIPAFKTLKLSQPEIIKKYIIPAREYVEKKPMKAPNGAKSNLTKLQWLQVRTKAFKDWFGDWEQSPEKSSQIVDENGEPRVMYRGEQNAFDTFNVEKARESGITGRSGDFFFFTSSAENARFYTEDPQGVKGYFLNVRTPLSKEAAHPRRLANEALSQNFEREDDSAFDGAIATETLDGSHVSDVVIIFPDQNGTTHQVKSAEGNSGGFSALTPNIYFREATEQSTAPKKQKPLVMFHGSPTNDISKIAADTNGLIFMSPDRELAERYARDIQRSADFAGHQPTVYKLIVDAKKTLDFNRLPHYSGEEWQIILDEEVLTYPQDGGAFDHTNELGKSRSNVTWYDIETYGGKKLFDSIKAAGYDSIAVSVYANGRTDREFVVFDTSQIRIERATLLETGGPTKSRDFNDWFKESKVLGSDGKPLPVYHGTTATISSPGIALAGDAEAKKELQELSAKFGIPDWTATASILERWVANGTAKQFGADENTANKARDLYEKSKGTYSKPTTSLAFNTFEMPAGSKELGAHFGTKTQASSFGDVFEFFLSIQNPLRLADLGTWDYQSVIREARKVGVSISEDEYDQVFNAIDNNAALRTLLLQKGIDGIVYQNEAEGKGDSYIAFTPEQIKSSTDNNGEYDARNPDIRFRSTSKEENFSKWLGESKIKEVIYHGTNQDFSAFDRERSREGDGIVFGTTNPRIAGDFAKYRTTWGGANIMPVYVKAEKVLEVQGAGRNIRDVERDVRLDGMKYGETVRDFAAREGYDAIIFLQVRDPVSPDIDPIDDVYALLPSAQMKSALGNNGEYDPLNADIRFKAPSVDQNLAAWSKASRAVDASGRLLTLYHGSPSEFYAFDSMSSMDGGFYFTESKLLAESFSKDEDGQIGHVIEANISLQNPKIIDLGGESQPTQEEMRTLFDTAKREGHDGAILYRVREFNGVGTQFVAFFAEQIKSTQNNGEYDPLNPDIRFKQATREESFAKWFGTSKTIDTNGKPRVFYHGTTADITSFQEDKLTEKDAGWYGRGIYLTSDPDAASAYANYEELQGNELSGSPRVIPAFVALKNPYFWPEGRKAALSPEEAQTIRTEIEADGYDGIIVPNNFADPKYASQYEVIAFKAGQIKSATGNNGDFDPLNNDIRFKESGTAISVKVFHGTSEIFDEFDLSKSPEGLWFSEDPSDASDYGNRLIEALISFENPATFERTDGDSGLKQAIDDAKRLGHDGLIVTAPEDGDLSGMHWPTNYVAFSKKSIQIDQTNTPKFREWFGNSQVKKDGKPLIVYHGTPNGPFDVFDPSMLGETVSHPSSKVGFFFITDRDVATLYSLKKRHYADVTTPTVVEAYLSIQSPHDIGEFATMAELDKHLLVNAAPLDRKGDGIVAKVAGETVWIAYDSRQIKSATQNTGEFSKNNSNIRFKEDSDAALSTIQEFRSNPRIQVLQQRGLTFDFSVVKGTVSLDNLEVEESRRSQGIGREAIEILTSIADRNDVAVTLEVGGESDAFDLPAWYTRHGFVWRDSYMERPAQRTIKTQEPLEDWIAGTAVVDDNGNPKVMYHGTPVGERNGLTIGVIDQFDRLFTQKMFGRKPTPDHVGSWFSDNPNKDGGAGMYTPQDSGVMYPVYLAIKNPWEISFAGLRRQCNKHSALPIDEWDRGWPTNEGINKLRAWMDEVGLDGIRIMHDPLALNKSTEFEKQDVFIALHPWQIRSAIGHPLRARDTEQQTRARVRFKEIPFSESFTESKLRTPSGLPMVFYHGTTAPVFDEFHPSKEGLFGSGIYFSGNAKSASTYAEDDNGHILPVYVNLKRPLYINASYEPGLAYDLDTPSIPLLTRIYDKSTLDKKIQMLTEAGSDMLSSEIEERVKALGYDGIVMQWDDGITDCVAYDTNAISFALSIPQSEITSLQKTAQGPVWVSSLIQALKQSSSTQATVDGWKNEIKGFVKKGIVKQDEVDWSTVNEWLDLQSGRVSAAALMSYLHGHSLDIKESILIPIADELTRANTALRGSPYLAEIDSVEEEIFFVERESGEYVDFSDMPEDIQNIIHRLSENSNEGAKYKDYAIPGGEDYREVLLFLPTFDETQSKNLRRMAARIDAMQELAEEFAHVSPERSHVFAEKAQILKAEFRDLYSKIRNTRMVKNFTEAHWSSTPNILAHARVTTRYDRSGKKTLFVEEIQSDWAQQGRKEGFGRQTTPLSDEDLEEMARLEIMDWKERTRAEITRLDDLKHRERTLMTKGAPTGPFVEKTDSWVSLMIKRLIRLASDENYDQIAFIDGEQSTQRYCLQKTVASVRVAPLGDNTYNLAVFNQIGESAAQNHLGITIEEISRIVGKELAIKIKDCPTGEITTFEGDDLKVGGHGMAEFYDKIVPAVIKKLITRISDTKLESIGFNKSMPSGWQVKREAGVWVVTNELGEALGANSDKEEAIRESTKDLGHLKEQLGFAITPSIREAVSQGMPMFQDTLQATWPAKKSHPAEAGTQYGDRLRQRAA